MADKRLPGRRTPSRRSGRRWALGGTLVILTLVAGLIAVSFHRASQPQSTRLALRAIAPDGTFTTVHGKPTLISDLQGHPALVWFVSTECGSCEAGTQAMAVRINQFARHGVKVVELRLADNLGAGGTDIATFGRQLTGAKFTNPDWIWGEASQTLTRTYDPKGYLDIYYLLDASGRIIYYNSAPDSTMNVLLQQVSALKG